MAKLSVITINLNNASGLQKTIESILGQTYEDIEYVIIDGASSDGSIDVIEQCVKTSDQAPKNIINYWKSEPDSGIYNALNKGLSKATGEYCLFLNSGDSLRSNSILSELFRDNHEEDIIYCNAVFTKDGNDVFNYILPEQLSLYFLYFHSICHQSTLIKRSLFDKIGFYNENNKITSDWEFMFKSFYSNSCTFKHLPFFLSNYEMGGISVLDEERTAFERDRFLNSVFPEKIKADYLHFKAQEENPLIKSGNKLKTGIMKRASILFIKILIRIEHIFIK